MIGIKLNYLAAGLDAAGIGGFICFVAAVLMGLFGG